MVGSNIQTVTVDRVSNGGNAIAQQRKSGKTIHVPAGEVGEEYDVRLVDKGSYIKARLVDRTEETQPRGPTAAPALIDIGKDILTTGQSESHSHEIKDSPKQGKLRTIPDDDGQEMRSRVSNRKK